LKNFRETLNLYASTLLAKKSIACFYPRFCFALLIKVIKVKDRLRNSWTLSFNFRPALSIYSKAAAFHISKCNTFFISAKIFWSRYFNLKYMKSILQFLRITLSGGILFLLPVVLIVMLLNKARVILLKISEPLHKSLPDLILGLDGANLLAIVLIIATCFISGLIFRSSRVRKGISALEEHVLSYLPGYAMLKSITTDAIGDASEHNMTTVLIRDGDTWNIGFLVEEIGKLCTVFIPEAPRHDSGEIKIVPTDWVKKIGVPSSKAARSLQRYGKGAANWIGNA
jgi:uncharacterized membrane protein